MSQIARDLVDWLERGLKECERWEPFMNRLMPWEAGAIAAGTLDKLTRPLEPTWIPGGWIEVRANLWIAPHKARMGRKGYSIVFDIRDFRARLLRRVPSMYDAPELDTYGEPIPPTLEAIERARQTGSYTTSPALAVPDAGEAIDEASQALYAADSQQDAAAAALARQERWESFTLAERLAFMQREADVLGVDISRQEREMERRIEALRRRVRKRAA